jgi:hypothetical protein
MWQIVLVILLSLLSAGLGGMELMLGRSCLHVITHFQHNSPSTSVTLLMHTDVGNG